MRTEPKNEAIKESILLSIGRYKIDVHGFASTVRDKKPKHLCLALAHSLFHTNSLARNLIFVKNTFYNCSSLKIKIIVETPFDIYNYKVSLHLQCFLRIITIFVLLN